MSKLSFIFFGSFQHYSLIVLEKLLKSKDYQLIAVVTSPPRPSGRHLVPTPTAVAKFATVNNIPLIETQGFESEHRSRTPEATTSGHARSAVSNPESLIKTRPDFIIVAGYGQLIPENWLNFPRIMAINMHPSLLPKYRGRFPAEWAILRGETQTGVTLIKMSPQFDRGEILSQAKIAISPDDTRDTLYTKLFILGAELLITTLPLIPHIPLIPLPTGKKYFYARSLTRADGFIPWKEFNSQLAIGNLQLARIHRALYPWPGVWTLLPNGQRLKLISLKPEVLVQLEGKKPIPWQQLAPSLS